MGHKVLIDGTAYEVSGGRCLVEGTGYDIQKGRTLVGGTGCDVVFSHPCTVTIRGGWTGGSLQYAYVVIDGTTYISEATVEVESGTEMTCYAANAKYDSSYGVFLNGTQVKDRGSYLYTIECNISVELTYWSPSGKVSITEE